MRTNFHQHYVLGLWRNVGRVCSSTKRCCCYWKSEFYVVCKKILQSLCNTIVALQRYLGAAILSITSSKPDSIVGKYLSNWAYLQTQIL